MAIDSTGRGAALGGCRWQPYADPGSARREAQDLARAMTLKAALAGLPQGGGKAVVIGDPQARTREQLLAFGRFVETLRGAYITAADMGTGEEQMAVIREATAHVVGFPEALGGCGSPAPHTALGVFLAIESALEHIGLRLRGSNHTGRAAGGKHIARSCERVGRRHLANRRDLAAKPRE